MKTYIKVLDDLTNCLNGTLNKSNANLFLKLIKELKNNFGKSVSTKFLRSLMTSNFNRKKTYRVSYFLKKSGLKTKKQLRDTFHEWVLNKYNIDITDYSINKEGNVFIKDIRNQQVGNFSYTPRSEILSVVRI